MHLARVFAGTLATLVVFVIGLASAMGCEGPKIMSPDRQCWAFYYKGDLGASFTTQALWNCRHPAGHVYGGGIVVYYDRLSSGIGFRWLSNDVLEISLDPRARLTVSPNKRRKTAHAGGRQLKYLYRDLTPADKEWRGCEP